MLITKPSIRTSSEVRSKNTSSGPAAGQKLLEGIVIYVRLYHLHPHQDRSTVFPTIAVSMEEKRDILHERGQLKR